jgi:hypothetical protein
VHAFDLYACTLPVQDHLAEAMCCLACPHRRQAHRSSACTRGWQSTRTSCKQLYQINDECVSCMRRRARCRSMTTFDKLSGEFQRRFWSFCRRCMRRWRSGPRRSSGCGARSPPPCRRASLLPLSALATGFRRMRRFFCTHDSSATFVATRRRRHVRAQLVAGGGRALVSSAQIYDDTPHLSFTSPHARNAYPRAHLFSACGSCRF